MKIYKRNIMTKKIYRANLYQSGEDAPTSIDFINNGFDGAWIREGVGHYYKQTTIPNTNVVGVWVSGGGNAVNAGGIFPIHDFYINPIGWYQVTYGFAGLQLRITVKFWESSQFDLVDMSTILQSGELHLPEIAVYINL